MNTRDLRFRSNRVSDIVALFHQDLDPMYGPGEVSAMVEILFDAFLQWDRVKLLMSKNATIDQSDLLRFHWALEDLKQWRPVQHIVAKVDFCGCTIEVGPDVLVPRPETEEMVTRLVSGEWWPTKAVQMPSTACGSRVAPWSCLDLCTGSGCIAIALKKAFPMVETTAVDISERALAVARRNAVANSTEVSFERADILSPQFSLTAESFHLIVSNPPYVRKSERQYMSRNVTDYDPEEALFVPDDDALRFYVVLARLSRCGLVDGGVVVVEINEALADDTCALFEKQGLATEVHDDFRGKPRVIVATKIKQ